MKPTSKQIRVINFLRELLNVWENSNDISSPSHNGDILETIYARGLDSELTQEQIDYLEGDIWFLLNFIRQIGEEK
jgi:hypothetical protein